MVSSAASGRLELDVLLGVLLALAADGHLALVIGQRLELVELAFLRPGRS
jgi:hypothetical protein